MKLVTVFLHKDTLYELTCDIKSFWRVENIANSTLRNSITKLFAQTNSIFRIVMAIFFMLELTTVFRPFLNKNMTPAGIYSYDENNRPLYIFVCVLQELTALTTFFYTPSMDMIYIGTCTSLMAQFKMLRDFLETANQRQNFLEDIKTAVDQHNLLLRYIFLNTL